MSNFTIDMGDPNFRTGAFLKYLEPIANTLAKKNTLDVKFLLSKHTFESIMREAKATKIDKSNSFIVDYQTHIDILGFGDWFIRKSYNNEFNTEEHAFINGYFQSLFNGWKPDLIICWEFPTTIFRSMFPNALVVDLMPGLFMRPPFPRTISFDPSGLYKDCVFGKQDLNKLRASDSELETYYNLKSFYELFFEEHGTRNLILSKFKDAEKFNEFMLVPLQITQYFGFYENCQYNSQFDFLMDVLQNTPDNIGVIATQYISGFIEEKVINDKNIDFLNSNFPNFLYSKEFEKVDNISQFIAPWADVTCSVSSTIGLQSKFFNRKLISPSRSHLSFFADQVGFSHNDLSIHHNNDNIMAIMMNRQVYLEERLLGDGDYLATIFIEMAKNKISGKTGVDLLPNNKIVKNVKENYIRYTTVSSFEAAARQMKKLGLVKSGTTNNYLNDLIKKLKEVNVVSFDVFDTLLCRAVFKPEDVFLMMQKELQSKNCPIQLPVHITHSFAQLRAGVERQLRKERDAQIAANLSEDITEEITINEVYSLMMERFGGDDGDVTKLVELEQELELIVLRERPVGKFLFNEALKYDKTILIISDFIHDEAFVARALESSGYTGYSKLYVSSKVGKKKHSGDLFIHVADELKMDTSTILHIGDNPIGDLSKAGEAGWNSIRISSSRERALEILKERLLSPAIINNSFFLRTTLSMFAEEFYQIKTFETIDQTTEMEKERGLVENGVEFGFLALGPLMLSFSDWILKQAKKRNCSSIVFFARDCYLPFKIVGKILKERGQEQDMDIHYIATSRRGLMGMNLEKPEDFLKVRIDDFARQKTFSELITKRFGLDPYFISEKILERWSVLDIDTPVGKLTPAAIYGVIYEHVTANWEEISKPLDKKRDTYRKYLLQKGVDLTKKTLGVDFGYKGSTHRMLNSLFEEDLQAAFFMTFADDFGEDPIENSESYFMKNINPMYKTGVVLSHNLIIETLVNEATGSLIEITENDSEIRIIKEELGSAEHLSKINAIHRGALQFADNWLRTFKDKPELTSLEFNSADYILSNILRKPSKHEAEILKGLVFDNAFAGHNKRYILVPKEGYQLNDSIWKEGHRILYPPKAKAQETVPKKIPKEKTNESKVKAPIKNPPTEKLKPTSNKEALEIKEDKGEKQKKETKKDIIIIEDKSILVNGQKFSKDIDALRILHRNQFVEVISVLAKTSPSVDAKRNYTKMIENNSKILVAAKLFQENGGISKANISSSDKKKLSKKLK